MININGKKYRNLQEQVGKNQEDIKVIKYGLNIKGQVDTAADLPSTVNTGDTYLVGIEKPYNFYIFIDKWVDLGTFASDVPGARGPVGEDGKNGVGVADAFLTEDGVLIIKLTNGIEKNIGIVVGGRGPIGLTGPRGEKGDTGIQGIPGPVGMVDFVATTSVITSTPVNQGIAVSTDDGKWYYWDGAKYVVGSNFINLPITYDFLAPDLKELFIPSTIHYKPYGELAGKIITGFYQKDGSYATNYCHLEFGVKPGQKFSISDLAYGWSMPACVFFDASHNKIGMFPNPVPAATLRDAFDIIIPPNCVVLAVQTMNGKDSLNKIFRHTYTLNGANFGEKSVDINNLSAKLQNTFEDKFVYTPIVCPNEGYFNHKDMISQYKGCYYSDLISIPADATKARIKCGSFYAGQAFNVYNEANEIVYTYPQNYPITGSYDEVFTILPNWKKIRFGDYHDATSKSQLPICGFNTKYGVENKKWNGKLWACMGDSLTEENSATSKHYFDYVADETGIQPYNVGRSGTGYAKLRENNLAFYQRVDDIPTTSDVITVFGSFNDLSCGLPVGTITDTGTSTIAGCINTTLDTIQARCPITPLGIITPTPWSNRYTREGVDEYIKILVDICKYRSIPCLNLFECSNLRPWDPEFQKLAYTHDGNNGVHPDETGHKIIAPRFKAFVETLIEY